jgi:site-specific DNA recombinase
MSIRAVIYARSSTRAQMERQTTRYQVEACREYANARGHDVIAELIDESVSGTVRMAERVAGSELLEITATRRCEVVLVFRFDRIARSSADLIATGRILRESGVGLWSVAESVWLSEVSAYSIGGFAERELDAISQRMSVGRDLVAREGRWVGGPVPFGYDLDDRGALVPSQREVAGMTESALARSVFERIASGSSTVAEARRLDELGVFPGRRYSERDIILSGGRWLPSRINQMVKNSLYLGRHVFRSRHGAIERDFPPLVESELWSRTQAALITNRGVPSGFARRAYLLRGLVRCANCGCRFAGRNFCQPTFSKHSCGRRVSHVTRQSLESRIPVCNDRPLKASSGESQYRPFARAPHEWRRSRSTTPMGVSRMNSSVVGGGGVGDRRRISRGRMCKRAE